uniref:Putative mutator protein n=1 Tax=Oryza sativa subsp. indica TaxID=39946 RepID=Q0P169_ORYSI|nr:putative mutator protein [Oryza sativa Indica Group]AAZ06251.1 putative mutator protein [Oryza sativa Indica Group]
MGDDHNFPIVQYADETLFYVKACGKELFVLKALLQTFAQGHGLSANSYGAEDGRTAPTALAQSLASVAAQVFPTPMWHGLSANCLGTELFNLSARPVGVEVEEDVDIGEKRHRDVEDGEIEKDISDGVMDVNQADVEDGYLLADEIYTCEECEEAMIFNGLNPKLLYADLDNEVDESTSNSDDDRPVGKMSEEERIVFEKIIGRNPEITQYEDLSNGRLAVADNDPQYDGAFDAMGEESRKGLEFRSMDELIIWLQSYSIRVHRPFHVKESNASVKYTVACLDRYCEWQIRARKSAGEKSRTVDGVHRRVFGHASWIFGQSVEAFKHLRPMLAIDGTFLTERENTSNWEWFINIV